MEYAFPSDGICQDCSTLRVSHLYALINGYRSYSRFFSRYVAKCEIINMSVPVTHGLKVEAWKDNSDSVDKHNKRTICSSSEIFYFSLLPDELLLYIFSFFNVYELCNNLAPVCARWWKLSKDPTLWKHLRFSFERLVDGEQIQTLLAGSPLLVTLELQSREDGGNLLMYVAAFCPRLKKLTVKFCDGLTEETFRGLVENCPHITYLNVEGSRVCSSDCYHTMAEFHKLTHLNLSHCHFLDNIGLIKIVMQCKHLEYIDIDGITGIHDCAVVCLTTEVGHCLTHLFLDGENLTDVAYKSLSACTKLKMLGISFCEQMTDVGLSGINGLSQLTFLKLRKGVQLTPRGLEKLFSDGRLSSLTHINLGECSLMEDAVLIAMASSCQQLTNLVLHWCWEVTDIGISAIVDKCCHLRVLDLVGVIKLTGESFRNISTTLPNLVILDLEACKNINVDLLRQVVTEAKNPSLRVFDYWGDPVDYWGDPVLPLEAPDDDEHSLT